MSGAFTVGRRRLWIPRPLRYVRGFGYEATLAAKLHGPKPKVLVVHPALASKSYKDHVEDAMEALGLARAVGWDILPGVNEPRGGWKFAALDRARRNDPAADTSALSTWHVDRGDESDDELDLDDPLWAAEDVRRQYAESAVVKVRLRCF